jgi:hypothetical protein
LGFRDNELFDDRPPVEGTLCPPQAGSETQELVTIGGYYDVAVVEARIQFAWVGKGREIIRDSGVPLDWCRRFRPESEKSNPRVSKTRMRRFSAPVGAFRETGGFSECIRSHG